MSASPDNDIASVMSLWRNIVSPGPMPNAAHAASIDSAENDCGIAARSQAMEAFSIATVVASHRPTAIATACVSVCDRLSACDKVRHVSPTRHRA